MVTTTHFLKKCVKVPKIEVTPLTPGSSYSKIKFEQAGIDKQKKDLDHQHKNAF